MAVTDEIIIAPMNRDAEMPWKTNLVVLNSYSLIDRAVRNANRVRDARMVTIMAGG